MERNTLCHGVHKEVLRPEGHLSRLRARPCLVAAGSDSVLPAGVQLSPSDSPGELVLYHSQTGRRHMTAAPCTRQW